MPRQRQPKLSSLENHPPNTFRKFLSTMSKSLSLLTNSYYLLRKGRKLSDSPTRQGRDKAISTVAIKRFVMKIVTGLNGT